MADTCVRNITHLREVARHYELCEFVQGPVVKGFDPEGIFIVDLNFVGYSNLTGIFTPQEIEGDTGSLETIINNNVKRLKKSK